MAVGLELGDGPFQPKSFYDSTAIWKKTFQWNACAGRVTFLKPLFLGYIHIQGFIHLILARGLKNGVALHAVSSILSIVSSVAGSSNLKLFCDYLSHDKQLEVGTRRCHGLTRKRTAAQTMLKRYPLSAGYASVIPRGKKVHCSYPVIAVSPLSICNAATISCVLPF